MKQPPAEGTSRGEATRPDQGDSSPQEIAPARLAASLLLLREGRAGPEVYMVRRHARSRFLPNALVFVGGQLEQADGDPALIPAAAGLAPAQAAARLGIEQPGQALAFYVAALRECFEEAGVLLACEQGGRILGAHSALPELRQKLLEQQAGLAQLLQQLGVFLLLGALRYLDRWITPELEPRRYDTRFFACRAPAGQDPTHDPGETTLGGWMRPAVQLAQSQAEQVLLAPPTLVLLELLATHQSVDGILAACPDRPVPPVQPRPLDGTPEGRLLLLLPGDHRLTDPGSQVGPEHYVALRGKHWEHVQR